MGPVEFLGEQVFEIFEIAEDGAYEHGVAGDVVAATRELDAALAASSTGAQNDVVYAPALAASLGRSEVRVGTPNELQRGVMLKLAMQPLRYPAAWRWARGDTLDGSLAGLALLALKAAPLPSPRSWAYEATLEGALRATFFVVLSRGEHGVTLTVTDTVERMHRLFEDSGAEVDLAAAVLGLRESWMSSILEVAFGVPFEPVLFQRVAGVRTPLTDLSARILAVIAAACPEDPSAGRPSEGELEIGSELVVCRLTPIRV
jgi:hypothetical protein